MGAEVPGGRAILVAPDGQSLTEGQPPPRFADVRLLEFVLALFLVGQGYALPVLPVAFPVAYLAMGVLVAVAATRRPQRPLTAVNGIVWLLVGLLGYYALVSATGFQADGAGDWLRRLLRLVLLVTFVGAAASGRLHLPSIVSGMASGLVLNGGLFYLGLAPRPYGDFLTGFAGDKNAAGLAYAVVGLLLLTVVPSRRHRWLVVVTFALLVFLTGSRTSMAGFAGGLVWLLMAGKLPVVLRWGVGAGLIWGLNILVERFARIGPFADREGTDWFRGQIAEGVAAKLAVTPPQGMGLGAAYVDIPQGRFYFHNSYDTLFVEGGYVALVVVVGLTLLVALRPFRSAQASWSQRVVEAATVALLISAWQLGEVFLTVSWGLVMATALQLRLQRESLQPAGHPDRGERR